MELRLERLQYLPGSTIGRLYVDGRFECYTLEDGIRTHKVYGETAIPAGTYRVVVTYSPRFKRQLPLVLDVPNFDGVRIHPGNTPANTLGCILVGQQWSDGAETIGASRLAFNLLYPKISAAIARNEPVVLNVMQEGAPVELATRAVRKPRTVASRPIRKATSAKSGRSAKPKTAKPTPTKSRPAKKKSASSKAAATRKPSVRRKSKPASRAR
jgi:hypothetical protein